MRCFPQPSSPPLASICRRMPALRSSLLFPSVSSFPSSDPALPGCKPGLHPMGARSRARWLAEAPSRRREPASAQRPGSLPGLCGDVVRAAQPARGRATAPRRVSGGEPVRLGGRFGIPKGRAPWARVPGRAAPAVLVGRHLRLACGRRLRGASSALGRARSKRPRKGRRPLPRAGMRLLSADGGVAMGRRGTGPCLRSRAGPALSAAEATRRPGGPGRRRGRLALVAAELVDVMPE